MSEVTQLLQAMADGDVEASDKVISIVYDDLRRMAAQRMAPAGGGQTLQPTALVHEAWLRFGADKGRGWQNRGHFYAAAATAMRSILVDRARRRRAVRHGGGQQRVDVAEVELAGQAATDDHVLAVHEALEKFALVEPEKAELVKLRYFAGLSIEEASEALKVSIATANRWWIYARAWLGREITF